MNEVEILDNKDYKEFLGVINYFTSNPKEISLEDFIKQRKLSQANIYVLKKNNEIVATGSLLLDYKFQRNLACVGHIEDVVVRKDSTGLGYGKKITDHLVKKAKELGCYKVILNCTEENIAFYEKHGFKKTQHQMAIYFD